MKTIVVTGANSGIGKAISLGLAKQGCKVIMVGKPGQKTDQARKQLIDLSKNSNIYIEPCDLSSLKQVKQLADRLAQTYPDMDVLINNAGMELMQRTLTVDGLEMVFMVNYIAPFILTNLLIQKLSPKKHRRIINTTSMVEKWGEIDFDNLQSEKKYDAEKTYYNSKLALLLFTYELASRYPNTIVTINCYEPGLVKTNFTRDFKGFAHIMSFIMSFFMRIPEDAAKTPIYLAVSSDIENVTGKCFYNAKEIKTSKISYDKVLSQKLWVETEKIVGLSKPSPH